MSAWAAGPPKQSPFEGDVPIGTTLKLTTILGEEFTGEVRVAMYRCAADIAAGCRFVIRHAPNFTAPCFNSSFYRCLQLTR